MRGNFYQMLPRYYHSQQLPLPRYPRRGRPHYRGITAYFASVTADLPRLPQYYCCPLHGAAVHSRLTSSSSCAHSLVSNESMLSSLSGTLTSSNLCAMIYVLFQRVELSEMTPLPHFEITLSIATDDFLILPTNPRVFAIMTLYGRFTLPL